jgi:tight adherence protein B
MIMACVMLVGATVAGAAESPIVIRDVSLAQYPRVGLQLTLPSGLVGESEPAPLFTVRENGRGVEVIGVESSDAAAVDVVLVIDASGSMEGKSMDAAKDAAKAFIGQLRPGSRVSIVSFADKPKVLTPLTTDENVLTSSISGLKAKGETALYDALSMAAKEAARAGVNRPIVVLLSDGGDTVSRVELDTALKDLKSADAPALVVALPSAEADYGALRSVARLTGGRFSTVGGADELLGYYEQLARDLQTSWSLTYVSTRPSTKDLDVVVTAQSGKQSAVGATVLPNPLFVQPLPADASALVPPPPASTLTLASAVGLVFVSVFSFIAVIALMVIRPKNGLDQLKYYDQLRSSDEITEPGGRDAVTTSVLSAIDYVAGKRGVKRFVYEQLERAGLPLRPTEYITLHLLFVVASGVLVEALTRNVVLGIAAVVLTTVGPMFYLDHRVNKRRQQFSDQLPDVLNLIAGSLRSGWGLQQSLNLVVEQMENPVSAEFARAETEIRLGREVESALEGVAKRMQSPDFVWAVAAITIQRDVGGNLAEVLDIVAATIRDRGALQRQISGLTAEGRLSAWILMVMPLVLIVLLSTVNPEYLSKLYTTGPGIMLFALGGVLLLIGAVWLRKIVVIEV